jgi:hypothetical protein
MKSSLARVFLDACRMLLPERGLLAARLNIAASSHQHIGDLAHRIYYISIRTGTQARLAC